MEKWKKTFEKYSSLWDELEKNKEPLKFGRKWLNATDLSGQFYCEKKVELGYLHGKIETEDKNIGRYAHEGLTEESVPIKLDED